MNGKILKAPLSRQNNVPSEENQLISPPHWRKPVITRIELKLTLGGVGYDFILDDSK